MGNNENIKIILGSKKNKVSSNVDEAIRVPLNQTFKQQVEFDRTEQINLAELFQKERNESTIFRPTSKIVFLFENAYKGDVTYNPYKNNLFYTDSIANAVSSASNPSSPWEGCPQFSEFDFIRTDNNVNGYTTGVNSQVNFVNKSATTYNWQYYITYPYENTDRELYADDGQTTNNWTWMASEGIPFIIETNSLYGDNVISFRCPMKHGLNIGESVKLSFDYNGTDLFQVSSLGNENFGTNEYIFNIQNIGYLPPTFDVGTIGTFKRVVNQTNPLDTESRYYVRKHKILTLLDDTVLVNAGFEKNIFRKVTQYEKAVLTPNGVNRISVKEGNDSYNLVFNRDIDIAGLRDNWYRPVSELFVSIIWRGYFGWTLGPNSQLKEGYEFNLPLEGTTPSTWWATTNSNSDTNLPISTYNTNTNDFYYVDTLNIGDVLNGDFCEYNGYEQIERVISDSYHKFTFNPNYFSSPDLLSYQNQLGYYYKPHHPITIKVFSTSINEEGYQNLNIVPDYSYYSIISQTFRWRDIYPYGYIDSEGYGVDYPFLNGAHYPYNQIIFRLFSDGNNISLGNNMNNFNTIQDPSIDDCE
jgi:hypothetical protein